MERAELLRKENTAEAISIYKTILDMPNENPDIIKIKETCTMELADIYGELKDIASLSGLLEASRTFFNVVSKAKAAKIGTARVCHFMHSEVDYRNCY